ncbi:lysozyme [Mergibacter septicus]
MILTDHHKEISTSQAGLELIGNAEGCRKAPYFCPANILTVGIGTTESIGIKIEQNRTYTEKEIAEFYTKGIKQAEDCVNRFGNGRNMPQGAFDAMTSITFNLGCSKMKHSTLFTMAMNGYTPRMCDQFPRWVYANGKKLAGLVKRREKEKALCLQR